MKQPSYYLINHHESTRLRMFDTFNVTKDVCPISLVKTIFDAIDGSVSRLGLTGPWFEKEDVCSRVVCYQIDVLEHTGADPLRSTVQYEIGIDVDNSSTLFHMLAQQAQCKLELTDQ